jgi:small conductance mechanosensitive channel
MQGEGGFDIVAVMDAVMAIVSTWGLRVVGALVLFVVGLMVCKAVRRSVRKALEKSTLDNTLVPFLSSLIYYMLLTFLILAVLSLFGIQTTSFIAVLGAAGLAIGLALQGTLGNFAAGVMLLIFRPFKIGDYIEAGGTAGTVQEIAIFSTTLHSPDNVRITVPNSGVYGSIVKNYSYNETRRNDMVFGISYNDDITKAVDVIQRALDGEDRVLKDPAAVIAVGELAVSSVNLLVRPWCTGADYWGLRWDLTRKIKEDLEAAGCSIPYPQQDVYMHQVSAS